jgi:hypothetical protein
MASGSLAVPLNWLGIRKDTAQKIDRFIGRLTFCFFPVAPILWLISHFIGGGRILFAIWILLLASIVKRSWESEIRDADTDGNLTDALLDRGIAASNLRVAKMNFWKWYTFDFIIIAGIIYDFNLPDWLET